MQAAPAQIQCPLYFAQIYALKINCAIACCTITISRFTVPRFCITTPFSNNIVCAPEGNCISMRQSAANKQKCYIENLLNVNFGTNAGNDGFIFFDNKVNINNFWLLRCRYTFFVIGKKLRINNVECIFNVFM